MASRRVARIETMPDPPIEPVAVASGTPNPLTFGLTVQVSDQTAEGEE